MAHGDHCWWDIGLDKRLCHGRYFGSGVLALLFLVLSTRWGCWDATLTPAKLATEQVGRKRGWWVLAKLTSAKDYRGGAISLQNIGIFIV